MVERIVSGILVAFGLLFLFTASQIPDEGSCPPFIVGQTPPSCEHTYPGTNIYIPTIWRILEALSVVCLGAGTAIFLKTDYRKRRAGLLATPVTDAIIGTMLVSATTALAFGSLVLPLFENSYFLSLTGLLYGSAMGLVISVVFFLLSGKRWSHPPRTVLS